MKSRNHSRLVKGFSLIELLIVVGILGVVLVFGTIASFSAIPRSNTASERDVLASLLIGVRARALANMNEKHQGIHVTPTEFILFEVDNLSDTHTDDPSPRPLNRTPEIEIENQDGNDEFDVVFSQLSANANETTITVSQEGANPQEVHINQLGGINW